MEWRRFQSSSPVASSNQSAKSSPLHNIIPEPQPHIKQQEARGLTPDPIEYTPCSLLSTVVV
jgi:hypothetical protein